MLQNVCHCDMLYPVNMKTRSKLVKVLPLAGNQRPGIVVMGICPVWGISFSITCSSFCIRVLIRILSFSCVVIRCHSCNTLKANSRKSYKNT